jgi:uncharacterized protein (DUF488 family)
MASEEFARGIERLEAWAETHGVAVMCAEAPWWRCHRRLLADALVVRGYEVRHIMSDREAVRHELTEFAQVEDGRITYPPQQLSLEA